jgi:hypothetical protein
VLREPVLCADGHTYERAAVTDWLATHDTSPLTGEPLAHTQLVPNYALRSIIAALAGTPPAAVQAHQPAGSS